MKENDNKIENKPKDEKVDRHTQTEQTNSFILNSSTESVSSENNQEKDYETLYNKFDKKSNKLKEKLNEISKDIIKHSNKLNKRHTEFKESELDWNKNIYNGCDCRDSCIFSWCCDCCKNFACFCCCLKKNSYNDDQFKAIRKHQKSIDDRLREIENIGESFSPADGSKEQNNKTKCFIGFLYFFSLFHFFALSEIHGILLALLKEIVRTCQHYHYKHYHFDKDESGKEIIKTFHYYLTESNFHDSSQINFNYATSFIAFLIIKSSKSKYILEKIYGISFIFIFSFSMFLLSIDYLTDKDLKEDNEDNKNYYGFFKLLFCLIIPYSVIYFCAGLISLLPNKILDDIFKKEGTGTNLWKLFIINLMIVISVTSKNFFDYYCLLKSNKEINNKNYDDEEKYKKDFNKVIHKIILKKSLVFLSSLAFFFTY